MFFVRLADAAQNLNGLFLGGFFHHNRLEAPLQGGVAFDVFAVLVQGGGANHLQLAARKRRLEDVGRIH